MNWESLATVTVRVTYLEMRTANTVRAWARKNRAIVRLSRYATNAYEGTVSIPMHEGRAKQSAQVQELRALLRELHPGLNA